MYALGMMQGRLTPRRPRPQSFPRGEWALEPERAHVLGFDAIEWLVTDENPADNPIWDDAGVQQIRSLSAAHHIAIPSVCADYLIAHPLTTAADSVQLEKLIARAGLLGVRVVLIPLLESASLKHLDGQDRFLTRIERPLEIAQAHSISLALETDLPVKDVLDLLERAHSSALGIYYDSGNATALGYDIVDEIRRAAPYLRGVHIKDRPRGGPNVPLGEGDVDFVGFLAALADTNYDGALILETGVGDDWLASATRNLQFMRTHLADVRATA